MGEIIHQTKMATIWWGDALDVMPCIDTESMDLVVTDPPYGVEWQSGIRTVAFNQLDNDSANDRDVVAQILSHCARVTAQGRHLYVFGPTDVLVNLKVAEPVELIWDKGVMGAGDLTSSWGPAHEPISFTVTKHRHGGQAGKSALASRLRKGTVLRFNRQTGRKVRHPSEKPVGLLMEMVESSSRQGDTVIDPFAGSGSTGVAALLRGRRCLLIESKMEYAEMAVERCKKAESVHGQGMVI